MRSLLHGLCLCLVIPACGSSAPGGPGDAGGGLLDGGGVPTDGGGSDGGGLPDGGGVPTDGGGSDDGGSGLVCPAGVVRVVVSPATASLTIRGPSLPQQQFRAEGEIAGGARVPIAVSWSLSRDDDGPPGTITGGGLYTPDPNGGGRVTVRADGGGCTGTATVDVRVEREVVTPGAPPDSASFFSGSPSVDAARTPVVVYPSDETRFPRNVFRILFQWRTAGSDLFRLEFSGSRGQVRVYSDGAHVLCARATPPAGCWEAPDDVWSWIASTHAGEEVQLRIAGALRAQPGAYYESAPLRLAFSRRDVRGAIFYWSTTAAGVRRSTVSDLPPDDYLVKGQSVDGTAVNCAACHTLSRDGRRLAAYVNNNLWVTEVTPAAPPPALFKGIPGSAPKRTWATFSPDNARIVLSAQGALSERDGVTGALLRAIALPSGKFGTHPDWSPDGRRLLFTHSEDADSDKVSGSDIAALPLVDGGFGGSPQLLVPRGSASETNAYPAVSPDGRHVAFVRSQQNTHGDDSAKLWIVSVQGGTPVRLDRANFHVSNQVLPDSANLHNNMPTWAPRGDLDWIAFNSRRAYGVVYAQGPQQIWVAAVDLGRLDGGTDPSYPAFRLPFQGLDENNHRPFWSLDVRRDLPDGGVIELDGGGVDDGGACTPEGAACDQELLQCCRGLFCDGPVDGGFACARIR